MRADAAFAVEQFAMSERQACRLVELDRSSYRYEPRADHNADLREELVKLARQKPRYGYRRLHVLLCKRGHHLLEVEPVVRTFNVDSSTTHRIAAGKAA